MAQYNSLNVKLSNSQLNRLKSAIKNETELVLRLSSNMNGNSNNESDFLQEKAFLRLLLTNYQLILCYQKLNYLRWCNQEDFLVDFLVHYYKQDYY